MRQREGEGHGAGGAGGAGGADGAGYIGANKKTCISVPHPPAKWLFVTTGCCDQDRCHAIVRCFVLH